MDLRITWVMSGGYVPRSSVLTMGNRRQVRQEAQGAQVVTVFIP